MLWQPVLLTGLGGTLALVGTAVAQFWQARTARRERYDTWSREDRYRLHGERRAAYAAFYLAAGEVRSAMAADAEDATAGSLDAIETARMALWREYTTVRLIGDLRVLDTATALMRMADGVAQRIAPFDPTAWVTAIDAYVDRARADLIPAAPGLGDQPKKTSASA